MWTCSLLYSQCLHCTLETDRGRLYSRSATGLSVILILCKWFSLSLSLSPPPSLHSLPPSFLQSLSLSVSFSPPPLPPSYLPLPLPILVSVSVCVRALWICALGIFIVRSCVRSMLLNWRLLSKRISLYCVSVFTFVTDCRKKSTAYSNVVLMIT